jgi:putative membrane protein
MNEETDNKTGKTDSDKSSHPAPISPVGRDAGDETGKVGILSRVTSVFGFGKGKAEEKAGPSDVGTQLAHERTDLAVNRSYLAIERTLMAWVRTSLSMISFGFTIGKLGQAMKDLEIKGPFREHTMSVEQIAHFLVVLGTVALIGSAVQHRIRMRELYAMGLRRQLSITFLVAVMLSVLGGFALAALILAL